MAGQRIGYKRASTIEQSTDRQLDGIAVNKVFEDTASGKDTARPQLQAALEFCREGEALVLHSMDPGGYLLHSDEIGMYLSARRSLFAALVVKLFGGIHFSVGLGQELFRGRSVPRVKSRPEAQ